MQKLSNFRIDFFYCSVTSTFAIKLFLLPFTSHCSAQNVGFRDSGYVIKPPQPSSALHGAPPFTGYHFWYCSRDCWSCICESVRALSAKFGVFWPIRFFMSIWQISVHWQISWHCFWTQNHKFSLEKSEYILLYISAECLCYQLVCFKRGE